VEQQDHGSAGATRFPVEYFEAAGGYPPISYLGHVPAPPLCNLITDRECLQRTPVSSTALLRAAFLGVRTSRRAGYALDDYSDGQFWRGNKENSRRPVELVALLGVTALSSGECCELL
jgi:hypothetical protein